MNFFAMLIVAIILSVIVGYFGVVIEKGLKRIKGNCAED